MRLAAQSGAKRHQARALLIKAALLKEIRPAMARRLLEKALALSDGMDTRLLTEKIRRAQEDVERGRPRGQR
jgi:hypothetical protein